MNHKTTFKILEAGYQVFIVSKNINKIIREHFSKPRGEKSLLVKGLTKDMFSLILK